MRETRKIVVLNTILLLVTLCSCFGRGTRLPAEAQNAAAPTEDPCESIQLRQMIRSLGSSDEKQQRDTRAAILNVANRSAALRKCVITKLVAVAAKPRTCADLFNSQGSFSRWEEADDILGNLKAEEAIDTLIKNLDCSRGVSLSVDTFPAAKAIVQIGEPALTQLGYALKDKRPALRWAAVLALHRIGGEKAKALLKQAAVSEKDKRVSSTIVSALQNWKR